MKLKYKKLLGKAIVIGCLVAFILLFSLIKVNQDVSEYFFARGVSRNYVLIVGFVASWFPFSLFDLFVTLGILTIILCALFIIIHIKKRRGLKALDLLERLLIAALSVALIYTLVASGNYYRKPIPLPRYEGEQLSAEETAALCKTLLSDYAAVSKEMERNADGKAVSPYTFEETAALIRKEYEKLDDDYFSSFVPAAKEGWYSRFLTSEGITGITFVPTGDAVVNKETPSCYKVVTTAHEIGHAVGCMREGDANLMAYYVLLKSDVPYFRYCAYMYGIGHLTQVLYQLDEKLYAETISLYPAEAREERRAEDLFWQERHSFMEDVGDFLNNLYLKLSGASNGTESYNDYSEFTVTYDEETEKEEVKVYYSATTRVLIKIAQDRQAENKA